MSETDPWNLLEAHRKRKWEPSDVSGSLRIALVGLGGFTVDRIAPAIERSVYAETTAVVSGSSEKATRIADQLGASVSMTYDQFEAGESASAYDAVFIGTPNALHLDHVQCAAEFGKAVLCEKPMEATVERSEAMVSACERANVPLMIAYRVQSNPVVRWARELVRSGVIGSPIHCRGSMSQRIFDIISSDPNQWRLNEELSGGAALIDLGIYPLNTARFLIDSDPVRVHAFERREDEAFSGVDEHISFEVEFESGALASCTASQNSFEQGHLHVTGTRGQITVEPAFMGPATVTVESDEFEGEATPGDADELTEEIDYFSTCVLTDTEPEPNGKHGLVDMKTIDAIYRSAAHGTRVDLN